ncbi:hypothetical protein ACIQF5_21410 [Streptomyces goshikiensis]|uniref:hypothetical protein n=1 Tax=Streptomyces goshikiensis TaxID=1942 RepID=UPI0038192A94
MAPDLSRGGRRRGRPPGKRKKYAREEGLVPSSIPAQERLRRCKACRTEAPAKDLRYGYCTGCWSA